MPLHATDPDLAGSNDPAIDALYHDIVHRHAEEILGSAARTIDEGGSLDEPGMLRIVLARLLLQEPNASQLAARAATLANAVSRLMAVQRRDRDSDLDQEIDDFLDQRDANRAALSAFPEGAPE